MDDAFVKYTTTVTIQANVASGGPAAGQPFEKVAKQILTFGTR